MSVSNIKERVDDILITGAKTILPEYVFRWQLASTLEAKSAIEGEAVEWLKEILEEPISFTEVKKGDALFSEDINSGYQKYLSLNRMLRGSFQALTQLYIDYENTKKLKLLDISGKLRRVHQKQSSLSLSGNEYKYSIVDSFLNKDWLTQKFLSQKVCSVYPEQGIVTLPIDKQSPVRIKNVVINGLSNGRAGNSDLEINTDITDTGRILDGSEDTWFEYERLDTGPCKLVLNFEFEGSQIINSLQIIAANLVGLSTFEIEDIVFSDSSSNSTSVKKLVNKDLPESFWTCNAIAADGYWNVLFLPVRAKTISVQLVQRNSTQIKTLTSDRREVTRDRYGIGIKEIRVFRNKYLASGQIGSTSRSYPSALYTTVTETEIFPKNPDLYNLYLEISTDDGSSWSQQENVDSKKTKTILLDGKGGNLTWRGNLERQDETFQYLESMTEEEEVEKDIDTLLKTFSKFNSPTTIALKDKPSSAKLFLMQPKVARRGDRVTAVPIHRSFGITSALESPVDFLNSSIDIEAVHLFINGVEYSQTEDNTTIETGEWSFSNDYSQLLLADDLTAGSQVRFVIDPELMSFEERSSGYFHKTDFLFDPDKKNIKI